MLITFYSFKGGVGRSMALVNVGEILADWGYNVILCDWDLEAPGLERYLTTDPQAPDDADAARRAAAEVAQYTARPGLMDLLYEYKAMMAEPPAEVERRARQEAGEDPSALDRRFKQVGKLYLRRPSAYAFPVSVQRPRPGSLRLLTAGRRDPSSYKTYAESVRTFDWEEFYRKWAGASYFDFFREELTDAAVNGADIVLIDSRTGVTEHGGVATHHLADLVLLLSAANELNLEGTDWMARELSSPRLKETRGDRGLGVLPVPSRIEQTSQKDELVNFRGRFVERFVKYALEFSPLDAEKFFLDLEIPYMPYYSFYERVAAREGRSREQRLYGAYEFIARSVVAHGLRARLLAKRPEQARAVELAETAKGAALSRIKGVVYLGSSPADDDVASVLAHGLDAEGLRVWSAAVDTRPSAEQVASEAAGYLVLVGREGFDERAQAEFDYALRQQVLRKECRLVPVVRGGVEQTSLPADFVKLRPVALPTQPSPDDGELFRRLAAELNAPAAPSVFPDSGQPYCGAGYFEENAARFFFGRDEEVRELVKSLGEVRPGRARWLQIEGVNGAGKTSLARAGLIPAIQRGWLRGAPRRWLVVKTVMGDDFLESFSVAFAYATRHGLEPSSLRALLSRPDGLRLAMRDATPPDHGFLLLVDGMERFSDDSDVSPRRAVEEFFESQLATALDSPLLPFCLVTTARSDVAEAWLRPGRLLDIFEREAKRFVVEPVTRAGLRDVIEGPAKLAGLNFEKGLVERIVADASGFRAPLAVLGPLLQRLWERRAGGTLTHHGYQELGGAGGVLGDALESLVGGLNEGELKCAKGILLRLVRVFDAGDGQLLSDAAAPVPHGEVLKAAGDGRAAWRVLNRLLSPPYPVVLAGEHDGLALAHTSLTRQPPLRDWVEAERESLRLRDDLKASARLREVSLKPDPQLFARFNLDAEEFFATLLDEEKSRLTGILSRLVAYDPETGSAATTKPIPLASIEKSNRSLVEKMCGAGLAEILEGAGPDGGDILRAHEFLLPGWNRFRDWVEYNRKSLVLLHTLTARTVEWEWYHRDPELLLKGVALKQAVGLASKEAYLSKAEKLYISDSARAERQARERERESRARKALYVVSAFLSLVVLLAAAYMVNSRYREMSQKLETASQSYREAASESNEYRARLHLSLMSEGVGRPDSKQIASEALKRVINLNSNTQQDGSAELARRAADALTALEAGDVAGARVALGDSPTPAYRP